MVSESDVTLMRLPSTTSEFMWRWAMSGLSNWRTGSTAQIYGDEWGSILGVLMPEIQTQRLRVGLESGTLHHSSPTRYHCAMLALNCFTEEFRLSLVNITKWTKRLQLFSILNYKRIQHNQNPCYFVFTQAKHLRGPTNLVSVIRHILRVFFSQHQVLDLDFICFLLL